jgi:poly(A) polymerase
MRTSEEIYHRVCWDPRFDPARFVLGINARGTAPKRVPLPAFVPGGDIPWHRVLFVEADGEVVWDRAAGVDRIDATTAGRVRAARRLRAPFFTAGTPHAWDSEHGGWRPAPPPDPVAPALIAVGLRVLTWNTLWDRYDSDRIHTARRHPLLLDALEQADADVIALQEVERGLLAALLAAPWVRSAYALDVDPARRDVDDSGLILLSRLPVRESGRHALGPYKAVAAITAETAAGPVVVATTHLTSDHTGAAEQRGRELTRLAEGLGDLEGAEVVLLGDFNDASAGPEHALGLRDAWTEIHGVDDRTPTFDPTTNPLAAVMSLTGRAARLDRVLLRGTALRAAAARLRGDAPAGPDGLFVSDHYGVSVDLEFARPAGTSALDAAPTVRTAVAWIPPPDLWPPIQRIRERHDPQVERWPPHVNLLFGFVPEADFDRAAPLVAAAAAETAPFTARLAGVHAFEDREGTTHWLNPAAADPAPWAALRAALARRFPRCAGRAYTPHLTLGREAEVPAPLSTVVGQLTLLSRRGEEPMRPRATVELGTGTVRWASIRQDSTSDGVAVALTDPRADGARRIVGRMAAALADGVVEVTGSRRMGCAGPHSDLDLVAALPDATGIEARVRATFPDAERLRPVVGARVPGLRFEVGGLRVDLVVVATGAIAPAEAVARRAELGDAAAAALGAVTDADAVCAAVGPHGTAFAALARAVRAWARARGLDSAPHGGVPGLAWTVLAARTVRECGDAPARVLLREFFGTWAAWDWRHAVGLDGAGPSATAMTILSPSHPVRSCTEQVGPDWRDLLTQELYEAWEGCESGPAGAVSGRSAAEPAVNRSRLETGIDALLSPPPMHRRHAAWAVVTVRAPDLDEAVGRVRGRTRALLAALERAGVREVHAWPRPFQTRPDAMRYAIGLGHTPPDAARLVAIAGPWAAALPEVEVTWAEGGGEVPTFR